MFWRWMHRFVLWSPAAAMGAYLAVLGIAASAVRSDAAQRWFDGQIIMWRAVMLAPYGIFWLLLIVAIWLAAFIWTGQKAEAYQLAKERANRPNPAALQERKQVVSVRAIDQANRLASKAQIRQVTKPKREVGLAEALGWVVYGKWGGSFHGAPFTVSLGGGPKLDQLLARVTGLASEGKLTIWGKRDDPGHYEQIDQSHWKHSQLQLADIFGSIVAGGENPYRSLMLNCAEVEREWPHEG